MNLRSPRDRFAVPLGVESVFAVFDDDAPMFDDDDVDPMFDDDVEPMFDDDVEPVFDDDVEPVFDDVELLGDGDVLPGDVLPDVELPDAVLEDGGCPALPLCPLDIVPDGGVPLAPDVEGAPDV